MQEYILKAQARTVLGKKIKPSRRAGNLPAVIYGNGVATRSLSVSMGEFIRVYKSAGESTLIDVVVDGAAPTKAIIQKVQLDAITGRPVHVDFHQVRMTEKLHAEIALAYTGESPAIKELGGVLVKNVDHVKVEALPTDLVAEIVVDISSLKTFDDFIHVSDLTLPKGITVLDKADDVIALVARPRSEEELADLEKATVDEKAAVEKVEGVVKEEKVEEGAEEGDKEAPKSDKKPDAKSKSADK